MSKVSRRALLKGIAAGAVVLGFDPLGRSWVTEARASSPFEDVPALDGVLSTDPTTLEEVADDWGHMIHRLPVAVLRAGSVDDIVKMVKFARRHGIKIATRGRGHTAFGQAQAAGGLVIDLRGLNQIHEIGNGRAVVDPGVVWRDLLLATLEEGQTPPVLTDYIDLTVAGTLSVGGVGGSSFRYGAQVDNVVELQVVTGAGDVVTCSRNRRRDLFDVALAGLGLCAIIVRVTVKLIPARDRARTYKLYYPDIPSMLDDVRVLVRRRRFDYVRGNGALTDTGWAWYIEATQFYDADPELECCDGEGEDDGGDPLRGLHFVPGATEIEDRTYFDYCDAVVQLFAVLGQYGLLGLPHPWLDLLVPGSEVNTFATRAMEAVDPALCLPGSIILFFPFVKNRVRQPMFRTPDENMFFLFDVLQTAPPDPGVVNDLLQRNRALYDQNRALGGTNYTISAVPLSREDWRAHFDGVWPLLSAAKQVYDPGNVLGAGLDIF